MMKKSVYRKVIFIMLCVALLLLKSIAKKVQVFQILMTVPFFPVIKSVLNNSWFCSICCSIIAVYLIYKWQVWYSKRKLKADFRCNEVIEGVYDGIEEFVKFYQEVPTKEQSDGCKTDLLLDSIQSCFFINLNFELLSIINHVKNRLPNLRKKYPEIEEIFTRYEKNQNEEDLIKLGNILPTYFMDLKFMACIGRLSLIIWVMIQHLSNSLSIRTIVSIRLNRI